MAKVFEKKEDNLKFTVKRKLFVRSELDRYQLEINLKGKKIAQYPLGQNFDEHNFKVVMGENKAVVQYPKDNGFTVLEYDNHMNENFYYVNVLEIDKNNGQISNQKSFDTDVMRNGEAKEYFEKLVKENSFSLEQEPQNKSNINKRPAVKTQENTSQREA